MENNCWSRRKGGGGGTVDDLYFMLFGLGLYSLWIILSLVQCLGMLLQGGALEFSIAPGKPGGCCMLKHLPSALARLHPFLRKVDLATAIHAL